MGYGNTTSNLPHTGTGILVYVLVAVAIVAAGIMLRAAARRSENRKEAPE